jgi:hypothetical protein
MLLAIQAGMTATETRNHPSDTPLPLVSFWCGVKAFIIAFLALPLWASGYGAIFAIAMDVIALPAWIVAITAGIPGLKDPQGGYALVGLLLAILAPVLTYAVFNSWEFAELFRFRG